VTERFVPWQSAWHEALYGARGFYRHAEGPAAHFRTSVHASQLLAAALARLARDCGLRRVVDVGSGRGELLTALADVDPGLELVGTDVVDRPPALVERARWLVSPGGAALPHDRTVLRDALVVAHEWLDDVPCPVVEAVVGAVVGAVVEEAGSSGWRQVLVDPVTGGERLGDDVPPEQEAWLDRWWPSGEPGSRAEVGLPRDEAWAELVAAADGSVLLAVDYAHDRQARPPQGTLLGYRHGRVVPAVPDGSCDITAHVALDAVARAGEEAGAIGTVLTTQRAALRRLGLRAEPPSTSSARLDPVAYLAALQRAGEAAELLDPDGLGAFGWLLQSCGPTLPAGLGRPGTVGITGDASRPR
jgi:SAM-dependent MidA family methyltransferase